LIDAHAISIVDIVVIVSLIGVRVKQQPCLWR